MVIETKPRYVDEINTMRDFPLRAGLSWKRRKEAALYLRIGRGTMGVFGPPGSGKDQWGISTAYLNKYYFGRKILLDFLPKTLFGDYVLFDGSVMVREINKMAKLAGVEGIDKTKDWKEYEEFVGGATEKWATEGEGYSLLKGSVLYLSELKRYCYKRNPHNRFNKFVGSINSVVRHLDLLVIGTHVFENEIDTYTFMQYVHIAGMKVYCTRMLPPREHETMAQVHRYGYIGADCAYGNLAGKPLTFYVDGNAPLEILGGNRVYDLWESKNYVNLKPVTPKEV